MRTHWIGLEWGLYIEVDTLDWSGDTLEWTHWIGVGTLWNEIWTMQQVFFSVTNNMSQPIIIRVGGKKSLYNGAPL